VATEGEPPHGAPKAANPAADEDGAGRTDDNNDRRGRSAGDQSRGRRIRWPRARVTAGEHAKEGPRVRVETSVATPAGRAGPWWSQQLSHWGWPRNPPQSAQEKGMRGSHLWERVEGVEGALDLRLGG
jgi:hypothetical protein